MKIKISQHLEKLYVDNHRNYNYALSYLLSSIDLETFANAFEIVDSFVLTSDKVEIDIDEQQIKTINGIFKKVDAALVEKLLWIAILFPEI